MLLFYYLPAWLPSGGTMAARRMDASIEESPRVWLRIEAAIIASCVNPAHEITYPAWSAN
jgi:hypothetical protein